MMTLAGYFDESERSEKSEPIGVAGYRKLGRRQIARARMNAFIGQEPVEWRYLK
jgi:hypothetical protein